MFTFWRTTIYKLSFLFVIFLIGCDEGIKKKFGEPPNLEITSETEIDYLTVYYYALPACMRCHIDTQSPNLSTYKSLVSKIGAVQNTILTGEMPPAGNGYEALSACQKLVLNTWISRGMPIENGISLGAAGNACY